MAIAVHIRMAPPNVKSAIPAPLSLRGPPAQSSRGLCSPRSARTIRIAEAGQGGAIRQQAMLRIERQSDGFVSTVRLSGRIQSDYIPSIRSAMHEGSGFNILDLTDVTLVDIAVVQFLIECEDEGIELVQCPLYVREWMTRERTEGAPPGSSNAT